MQSLRAPSAAEKHPTSKKWACAHWCVPPNPGTTQQFQCLIYARKKQKTNRRWLGFECCARDPSSAGKNAGLGITPFELLREACSHSTSNQLLVTSDYHDIGSTRST